MVLEPISSNDATLRTMKKHRNVRYFMAFIAIHTETMEDMVVYISKEESAYIPDRTFKHFKGGIYLLRGYGVNLDSGEKLVVYMDSNKKMWARPVGLFEGYKTIEGKQVKTFVEINTDTKV